MPEDEVSRRAGQPAGVAIARVRRAAASSGRRHRATTRIEGSLDQVRCQEDQRDQHRQHDGQPLNHRIVAGIDACCRSSDARCREWRKTCFGDHGTANHSADIHRPKQRPQVEIGALRSTCRNRMMRVARPLDRAKFTYSAPSTPIMAARRLSHQDRRKAEGDGERRQEEMIEALTEIIAITADRKPAQPGGEDGEQDEADIEYRPGQSDLEHLPGSLDPPPGCCESRGDEGRGTASSTATRRADSPGEHQG